MASSRTVIIAGAGIGGLTAALAIARHGFDVTVFDQAQRLEEIGAAYRSAERWARLRAVALRDFRIFFFADAMFGTSISRKFSRARDCREP